MAHGAAAGFGARTTSPGWSVSVLDIETWSARPEVAAPLILVAGLYAVGWWRLSGRGGSVSPWRIGAAGVGLLALAVALLSPLDGLAHALFSAHMLQHLLLVSVAAPLLLLADPFAALLWGLPAPLRALAGRLLRPRAPLRRLWWALTAMPVAWLVHVLVIWLWHLPVAYDAAVADRLLHDLEHLAFFGSALLFWWSIAQPAPRVRARPVYSLRVIYLVLAAVQTGLLGLLLTLSPQTWYRSYASPEDQALGGMVMWGAGGALDMLAVLILLFRYLSSEEMRGPERVPHVTAPTRET
ncbi:MAG TPA: cytochrome c oxidase assembly protein [Methylomirabilota bacterium]|nr:cytochrome c oxidase assembly protein [Methylomirabilota bacterium]